MRQTVKKHSNIFFLLLLIPALMLIACSEKKYNTPESVIYANAKYMTEENLSAVMQTIHPESPVFENTEKMAKELFNIYDMSFKIEHLQLLEENNNEATVKFIQVTTKISGGEFNNNRATGIHTLRKDGDSWKIFSTRLDDVQYL